MASKPRYAVIKHEPSTGRLPFHQFYLRIAGFIILEGSFLTLAALALAHPLPIPTSLNTTNGKAVCTIIFILWHFLATLCLEEIVLHCFASEWEYNLQRTGELVSGATDRVSTLTAGTIDFIKHAITKQASLAFRLALIVQLTCLAIRGLLPGAIVLTSTITTTPMSLKVANMTRLNATIPIELAQARAALISRVEIREGSKFGLGMKKNWIVGWPRVDSHTLDLPIRYPTDVIHYDFKCHWEAPNFDSEQRMNNAGVQWYAITGYKSVPGINDGNPVYGAVSQVFAHDDAIDLSAFLFIGANSTHFFPSTYAYNSWDTILNLDGVPTTFNSSGFYVVNNDYEYFVAWAPLASLLICDPQVQVTSGEAILWPNGTLEAVESSLGHLDRLGNFRASDIHQLFTRGSTVVFYDIPDTESELRINDTQVTFNAAVTFLNESTLSDEPLINGRKGIFTLPIDQIETNMNTMFSSIAKAYSDGLTRCRDIQGVYEYDAVSVEGFAEKNIKVLVTSRSLFWIAVILFVTTSSSIASLAVVKDWRDRVPLSIGSLLQAMEKEKGEEDDDSYIGYQSQAEWGDTKK